MIVNTSTFGYLLNGDEVKLFTFKSPNQLEIKISNYGGIITSIKSPDRNGNVDEICAGFDNLDQYLNGHPHFGVIVGRFANRIANGKFTINNKLFELPVNNGKNHLHGGDNGFHTKLWDYKLIEGKDYASLRLSYLSPDREEGYPGNLRVNITYSIHDDNCLIIDFEAQSDEQTHVNLTSHGYFNLNGFKSDIRNHYLSLDSISYIEVDESQIPTGIIKNCFGTPFDFSKRRVLRDSIDENPNGIDHCFELNTPRDIIKPAAELIDKESGRSIVVYTSQPGIQVYTGNSLDGSLRGHKGTAYHKQWAICLETQHFPDTPNQPNFPTTLLEPNVKYHHQTRFQFDNRE